MAHLRSLVFAALTVAVSVWSAATSAGTISPEDHIAVAPDVAVNAAGDIAVLWVDRSPELSGEHENHDRHLAYTDLYVAISRDGGATFAAPVKINHDSGVVWGQSVSRPRIVGDAAGTWHVTYAANEIHEDFGKPALTMHYTRSTDGAQSFEAPRRLSTLTDADMSEIIHGGFMSAAAFQTIAAAPNGDVRVFWLDTRHMSPDLETGAMYTAVSKDGGATFSENVELMESKACPCCQFMAAADAGSNVFVGYRHVHDGNIRQSTIRRIDAETGEIGPIVDAGSAPWEIAGCPLKPTVLATRENAVYTAVYSGGEEVPGVYFSYSTDGGQSFARSTATHAEALVSDAPSIAVNADQVVVAWHAKTDKSRQVFIRTYGLDGQAAGGVMAISDGASSATGPVVATREDGSFQIVWEQDDRVYTKVLTGTSGEIQIGSR
jgi:hypothetical protein